MTIRNLCSIAGCAAPGPFLEARLPPPFSQDTALFCGTHHRLSGPGTERQRARDIAGARTGRNWSLYLVLHDKPKRPTVLARIASKLTDSQYWRLVGNTWTETEFPSRQARTWRALLGATRAGRDAMMSTDEVKALSSLPSTLTVYRGCSARGKRGFSWTTDRRIAESFSKRFSSVLGAGLVVSGTCRRKDVIAFFNGRGEREILILPEFVSLSNETKGSHR